MWLWQYIVVCPPPQLLLTHFAVNVEFRLVVLIVRLSDKIHWSSESWQSEIQKVQKSLKFSDWLETSNRVSGVRISSVYVCINYKVDRDDEHTACNCKHSQHLNWSKLSLSKWPLSLTPWKLIYEGFIIHPEHDNWHSIILDGQHMWLIGLLNANTTKYGKKCQTTKILGGLREYCLQKTNDLL